MTLKTKYTKFFALSILGLAITGCQTLKNTYSTILPVTQTSSDQEENLINYQKCPSVEIVPDLSMLSQFAKNTSAKASHLESSVTVTSSNSTCTFSNKTATVDIILGFDGTLGPKGHFAASDRPIHTYPFFVAITNNANDIIAKEVFAASINYPNDTENGTYTETIRQIIPVGKPDNAKNFTISVGFQLSEEELEYNRAALKAAENAPKEETPPKVETEE